MPSCQVEVILIRTTPKIIMTREYGGYVENKLTHLYHHVGFEAV